eukprot:SAG11_NODE_1186_length_5590_cov_2.852850_4_plen_85_part_00
MRGVTGCVTSNSCYYRAPAQIGEGNEASNEVDLVAAVEGAETQEGWELEEMENLRASLTRMKFKFVAYSNLVYARVRSSFAIPK